MSEFKFMVVTPEGNVERLMTVEAKNLKSAIYSFFIEMLVMNDTNAFQELLASERFYAVEGDTEHQPQDLIKAFDEGGR